MTAFLTTRELASLLRVKERKVYDVVASGALPVRRVTGKLLFPRDEIDDRLGSQSPPTVPEAPPSIPRAPPLVSTGGRYPLLEWALRQSRSGIAAFLDGAVDGGIGRRRAHAMGGYDVKGFGAAHFNGT